MSMESWGVVRVEVRLSVFNLRLAFALTLPLSDNGALGRSWFILNFEKEACMDAVAVGK